MKNDQPFDDIIELIHSVPSLDGAAFEEINQISKKFDLSYKLGSKNTDIIKLLAAVQGYVPVIKKPLISIFAGTHGVAESIFDEDIVNIAKELLKAVSDGSSGVRGIAKSLQAAFKVYELVDGYSTPNS